MDGTFRVVAGLGPILLGIAMLVALWALPDSTGRRFGDPLRALLHGAGWASIAIGLLLIPAIGLEELPAFIAFGVLVLILAAVAAVTGYWRARRAGQRVFVTSLSCAAERGIPLAPVIEALAIEKRGRLAARSRRLARALESGKSLPDALEEVRGLASRAMVVRVRAAHEAGALAEGLRGAAEEDAPREELWARLLKRAAYVALVTGALFLLTLGVEWLIGPVMRRIFQDFAADLPSLTRFLYATTFLMAQFTGAVALAAGAILAYALLRLFGWIDFDLPGVAWFVRRLDSAVVLDALALAARRERPLVETIGGIARRHPKRWMRSRLFEAMFDIQRGGLWTESLLRRRLIGPSDLAVLQAAERLGNVAWALAELADRKRRVAAYRMEALLQCASPLVILALGAVVACVVVGYFMPLVTLILRLARLEG